MSEAMDMSRILVSSALVLLAACTAQTDKETTAAPALEKGSESKGKTSDSAQMDSTKSTKESKTSASEKPKLTKEQAMKALMTPPGQRETPEERAKRIAKSLENDNPAERLFPKGQPDPAAGGKPLPEDKRACVDNCFNGLDVERVCETRVPPDANNRDQELSRCHDGARKFCGDRCRLNPAPPTRQRPLPEPEVVDAKEFSKRHKISSGEKLFVTLVTNQGTMIGELFWEKVPNTVANFVELAEGTRGFIDPKVDPSLSVDKRIVKRPYYDGLIFHRVIPGFMIQGGDIAGTGGGGPGYTFRDEFVPGLIHDGPGIFSMANAGPGTNGSQFFITEKATPHLNNRHSVFGKLIEGIDVQNKIARVESDRNRPLEPVVMQKVLIGRGKPKRP